MMPRHARMKTRGFAAIAALLAVSCSALQMDTAKAPDTAAPGVAAGQSGMPLYFREDWKEIPAAPVTQEHVNSPELVLHTYGSAKDQIKKSHHEEPPLDPYYIWSGETTGRWGITLSRQGHVLDLSQGGVVRWRSNQSGQHFPRILIRLLNGDFYVSNQTDTNASEWHVFEFILSNVTWSKLDPESLVQRPEWDKPDLTQVVEVGFTDLEAGAGSDSSSRIDWIEVFGQPRVMP